MNKKIILISALIVLLTVIPVYARCFGIPEFGEGKIKRKEKLSPALKIMKSVLPKTVMLTSCVYASVNKKIYCFGGWNGESSEETIVEFDPFRDKLIELKEKLPSSRYQLSCVYADKFKKIYCFGGAHQGQYISDILEFDPTSKKITKKSMMNEGRLGPGCVYSKNDDMIYCFGGASTYGGFVYNPVDNSVASFSNNLPGDTMSCLFSEVDNKIYCFGAWDRFQNIYSFDEETRRTTIELTKLPQGRGLFSCHYTKDQNIYCIGGLGLRIFGRQTGITDEILKYNPITKKITEEDAKLPLPLYGMSSGYVPEINKIYLFGGFTGKYAVDEIIEYNPSEDTTSFEITEELVEVEEEQPSPPIAIEDRPAPVEPPKFSEEQEEGIAISQKQITITVIAIVIYLILMFLIFYLRSKRKNKRG